MYTLKLACTQEDIQEIFQDKQILYPPNPNPLNRSNTSPPSLVFLINPN